METYRCSFKSEEKEFYAVVVANNMYQVINMFGIMYHLKKHELELIKAARIDTSYAAVYTMYFKDEA